MRSLRTASQRIQFLSAFFVFLCALVLALQPVLGLSRGPGALILASLNGLALVTLFCGLVAAALDTRSGMSIALGGVLQG
jgi:hypothetical protein